MLPHTTHRQGDKPWIDVPFAWPPRAPPPPACPGLPSRPATPTKPVRVISPYAAGGEPDVQLRQSGPAWGAALGQPIVVENKVGAAGDAGGPVRGAAGARRLHAADGVEHPPDPEGAAALAALRSHRRLRARGEPRGVADRAGGGAESPWKTYDQLVAAIRAKPENWNYSSGGLGTSAHLAGATMVTLAKLGHAHPTQGVGRDPAVAAAWRHAVRLS